MLLPVRWSRFATNAGDGWDWRRNSSASQIAIRLLSFNFDFVNNLLNVRNVFATFSIQARLIEIDITL